MLTDVDHRFPYFSRICIKACLYLQGFLNLFDELMNEISMNELASIVIRLTKSNSKIIFNDLPQDDPKRRNPDISLAIKKLNWNPEYDLDEGLINTIKYFKEINVIN